MAEVDANNNSEAAQQKSEKDDQNFMEQFSSLKPEDLVRGSDIADVEKRSLELCSSYIAGSWAKATIDDIEVKRISGGLTNQLYKVALKDTAQRVKNVIYPDEPSVVAIKYYQAKHLINFDKDKESERLNDIIILTILSEVGLGPQVYGIFNDGVIQAFVEHEQFRVKHQQNPKLLKKLAQSMARVNYLSVPVRKDNNWMIDEMQNSLDAGFEPSRNVVELIDELNLELLKTNDIREEFVRFKRYTEEINAPRVFTHYDFRGSNILVTKDEEIKLVDLEYSAYGYRGFDIGTFLIEWGRELFNFQDIKMPEDSILENFIKMYIEECDVIMPGYSQKPENSLQTILNETKFFIFAQFMFFMTFLLKQSESFIDAIPFDQKANLRYVENSYKSYLEIKDTLIKDGIIKNP